MLPIRTRRGGDARKPGRRLRTARRSQLRTTTRRPRRLRSLGGSKTTLLAQAAVAFAALAALKMAAETQKKKQRRAGKQATNETDEVKQAATYREDRTTKTGSITRTANNKKKEKKRPRAEEQAKRTAAANPGTFDVSASEFNGVGVICGDCKTEQFFNRSGVVGNGCDYTQNTQCRKCKTRLCLYCGGAVATIDTGSKGNTSGHNIEGVPPRKGSRYVHFGFRHPAWSEDRPVPPRSGWCLKRPGVGPLPPPT